MSSHLFSRRHIALVIAGSLSDYFKWQIEHPRVESCYLCTEEDLSGLAPEAESVFHFSIHYADNYHLNPLWGAASLTAFAENFLILLPQVEADCKTCEYYVDQFTGPICNAGNSPLRTNCPDWVPKDTEGQKERERETQSRVARGERRSIREIVEHYVGQGGVFPRITSHFRVARRIGSLQEQATGGVIEDLVRSSFGGVIDEFQEQVRAIPPEGLPFAEASKAISDFQEQIRAIPPEGLPFAEASKAISDFQEQIRAIPPEGLPFFKLFDPQAEDQEQLGYAYDPEPLQMPRSPTSYLNLKRLASEGTSLARDCRDEERKLIIVGPRSPASGFAAPEQLLELQSRLPDARSANHGDRIQLERQADSECFEFECQTFPSGRRWIFCGQVLMNSSEEL